MSGPRHLWSGDWQWESERAAQERAAQQPLEFAEPEPAPAPEPPSQGPRRRLSLRYAALVGVLVIAVGVALGLTLPGGSPKKTTSTTTQVASPTTPQASPTKPPTGVPQPTTPKTGSTGGAGLPRAQAVPAGPTANWLGMQIVTSPNGAVVSQVQLGSAADIDGFEPGDAISSVAGQQIDSVPQLRTATANIPIGTNVQVEIDRGSTVISVAVALKERPTIQP